MPDIDPITVSVVQHRLHAIVDEMGEAMLRTSYSQILNSSRDFSTALSDPEGRLIAQAEHVPIHVGALPWAVRSVHEYFRGRINPGDVFLLNDPYRGGNHLPDLTAFVPVFDGDRLAFWAINRSHQSDIGGATHGAYNPGAKEIWQEGIRVPPLRLYDRGRLIDDVNELLVLNVRHPRDFRGDLAAMIGSARVGERRLLALLAEFGSATTHAAIEAVLDGAERHRSLANLKGGDHACASDDEDCVPSRLPRRVRLGVLRSGHCRALRLFVLWFLSGACADRHERCVAAASLPCLFRDRVGHGVARCAQRLGPPFELMQHRVRCCGTAGRIAWLAVLVELVPRVLKADRVA